MVPYADLFNHNPFANSYIDARQSGFFTKTDEVVVYADRSYKKMEQVFIPYCCYTVLLCTAVFYLAVLYCIVFLLTSTVVCCVHLYLTAHFS